MATNESLPPPPRLPANNLTLQQFNSWAQQLESYLSHQVHPGFAAFLPGGAYSCWETSAVEHRLCTPPGSDETADLPSWRQQLTQFLSLVARAVERKQEEEEVMKRVLEQSTSLHSIYKLLRQKHGLEENQQQEHQEDQVHQQHQEHQQDQEHQQHQEHLQHQEHQQQEHHQEQEYHKEQQQKQQQEQQQLPLEQQQQQQQHHQQQERGPVRLLDVIGLRYQPTTATVPSFYSQYRDIVAESLEEECEASPALEDLILVNVLGLLNSRLPSHVRDLYRERMRRENHRLSQFRSEILEKVPTFLASLTKETEVEEEEVITADASGGCRLCRLTGQSPAVVTSHSLGDTSCPQLTDAERRHITRLQLDQSSHHLNGDIRHDEENFEEDFSCHLKEEPADYVEEEEEGINEEEDESVLESKPRINMLASLFEQEFHELPNDETAEDEDLYVFENMELEEPGDQDPSAARLPIRKKRRRRGTLKRPRVCSVEDCPYCLAPNCGTCCYCITPALKNKCLQRICPRLNRKKLPDGYEQQAINPLEGQDVPELACPLCGYYALSRQLLNKHIISCGDEAGPRRTEQHHYFSCQECGFAATTKRAIKQHFEDDEHQPVSLICCAYCDKKFKGNRSGNLIVHRKLKHWDILQDGVEASHSPTEVTPLWGDLPEDPDGGMQQYEDDGADISGLNGSGPGVFYDPLEAVDEGKKVRSRGSVGAVDGRRRGKKCRLANCPYCLTPPCGICAFCRRPAMKSKCIQRLCPRLNKNFYKLRPQAEEVQSKLVVRKEKVASQPLPCLPFYYGCTACSFTSYSQRSMGDHFEREQHQPNTFIFCSDCDKRFQDDGSPALALHRKKEHQDALQLFPLDRAHKPAVKASVQKKQPPAKSKQTKKNKSKAKDEPEESMAAFLEVSAISETDQLEEDPLAAEMFPAKTLVGKPSKSDEQKSSKSMAKEGGKNPANFSRGKRKQRRTRACKKANCPYCQRSDCGVCHNCRNPAFKNKCVRRICPRMNRSKRPKSGAWSCNNCGKMFTSRNNHHRHMQFCQQTEDLPSFGYFRCSKCDFNASSTKGMQQHTFLTQHAEASGVYCSYCHHHFRSKRTASFRLHMMTHREEQPQLFLDNGNMDVSREEMALIKMEEDEDDSDYDDESMDKTYQPKGGRDES